jgi:hypothetical protein
MLARMATSGTPRQGMLVTYAVLVGLTPLVPLPLLDDIAQRYLERRLAEKLASAHGLALQPAEVSALAIAPPSTRGALFGCLTTLVLYPIKKIFRKVFFFLEIKRTVDLVTGVYAGGYVLDQVLEAGLCAPQGKKSAAEVRAAVDRAIATVGTTPIRLAVSAALGSSKAALKAAAAVLRGLLERLAGRPSERELAAAIESVEAGAAGGAGAAGAAGGEVGAVSATVERLLERVPAEHFTRLRDAALDELRRGGLAPLGCFLAEACRGLQGRAGRAPRSAAAKDLQREPLAAAHAEREPRVGVGHRLPCPLAPRGAPTDDHPRHALLREEALERRELLGAESLLGHLCLRRVPEDEHRAPLGDHIDEDLAYRSLLRPGGHEDVVAHARDGGRPIDEAP